MAKSTFLWLCFFCIGIIALGCAPTLSAGKEKISARKAILLAVRLFPAADYPIERYEMSLEDGPFPGNLDDVWIVMFKARGDYAMPGNFFFILVNKTNGAVRVKKGD